MARTTTRRRKTNTNQITVKVGRSGGRVEEYILEGDEPTVGDALEAADISISKGQRIRLGGDVVDEDTIVEDGDMITVQGKVSGGQS